MEHKNEKTGISIQSGLCGGLFLKTVFIHTVIFLWFVLLLSGVGCSGSEPAKPGKPKIIAELRSELDFGEFAKKPEIKGKESTTSADEAGLFAGKGAEKGKKSLWEGLPKKVDPAYLALTRFEPPPREIKKKRAALLKKKKTSQFVAFRPRDKPIIFGGRGFELQGFEEASKLRLFPGFYRIIDPPLELEGPEKKETLDLSVEKLKEKKELIFHTRSARFGKIKFDLAEEEFEKKVPKKKVSMVTEISETQVLLSQPKDEMLLLQPAENEMDLLIGNEEVNRAAFRGR